MRSLLLIAAVCVAGVVSLSDSQVCKPGSNFKIDCNSCRCSADGKLMSCTRKFCIPQEQGDDPQVNAAQDITDNQEHGETTENQVLTNGQVCKPNDMKMEDCNLCKCSPNGIGWFCTRKACTPRQKRDSPPGNSNSEVKCSPGTSFKMDCNTCFCTETGIPACTMMFCLNGKQKRDTSQQEPECTPGTNFKSADGCNDCFCTPNGLTACTLKACLPVPLGQDVAASRQKRDAVKKCVPGESFPSEDGCNNCVCTKDGFPACTEMACLVHSRSRRSPNNELPKSEIAPGAPGFSCTPKQSFKYQCNTCICGDDGKLAACTFKFCIPGEY